MKKMMLLAGLLVLGAAVYANENITGPNTTQTDSFKARATVVEKLGIKMGEFLDFGFVAQGTQDNKPLQELEVVITGAADQNINVTFNNGKGAYIDLNNDNSTEKLTYHADLPKEIFSANGVGATTLDENGKVSFKIGGTLKVPEKAATGEYISNDVVISVKYEGLNGRN